MRLHTTMTFAGFLTLVIFAMIHIGAVTARECPNPAGMLCQDNSGGNSGKRGLPRQFFKRQSDSGCEVCDNGLVCWINTNGSSSCTSYRTTITETVTATSRPTTFAITSTYWRTITTWSTVTDEAATIPTQTKTPQDAPVIKRQAGSTDWKSTVTTTVTGTRIVPVTGAAVEVTAVTTIWHTTTSLLSPSPGAALAEPVSSSPPVGAIVGGIVGSVIALGIIMAVGLVIFRRRQRARGNGGQNEKVIAMPVSDDDSETNMRAWNPSRGGGAPPLRPSTCIQSLRSNFLKANIEHPGISIPETAIAVPIPPPTSPTLQVFSPLSTHHHRDSHAPSENVFSPLSTHHHGDNITSPADDHDHSAHSSVTFTGPPRLSLDLGSPVSPVDMRDGPFDFSSLHSGTASTTHTIPRKPVPRRE